MGLHRHDGSPPKPTNQANHHRTEHTHTHTAKVASPFFFFLLVPYTKTVMKFLLLSAVPVCIIFSRILKNVKPIWGRREKISKNSSLRPDSYALSFATVRWNVRRLLYDQLQHQILFLVWFFCGFSRVFLDEGIGGYLGSQSGSLRNPEAAPIFFLVETRDSVLPLQKNCQRFFPISELPFFVLFWHKYWDECKNM